MPEFYMIRSRKISKIFFMIFARKINKIPAFYMIFAQTVPEFYTIIARKNIFPDFLWGPAPRILRLWRTADSSTNLSYSVNVQCFTLNNAWKMRYLTADRQTGFWGFRPLNPTGALPQHVGLHSTGGRSSRTLCAHTSKFWLRYKVRV